MSPEHFRETPRFPIREHELTHNWCRNIDLHDACTEGPQFLGEAVLFPMDDSNTACGVGGFDLLQPEMVLMEVATNYLPERFRNCTARVLAARKLTPYSMPRDGFPTMYVNMGPGVLVIAYTDATDWVNVPKYFSSESEDYTNPQKQR